MEGRRCKESHKKACCTLLTTMNVYFSMSRYVARIFMISTASERGSVGFDSILYEVSIAKTVGESESSDFGPMVISMYLRR